MKITLVNPNTGAKVEVKQGFSLPSLFFGIFYPIYRGDLIGFIFQLALASFTFGLSWLVVPFMYNKRYMNRLIDKGFVVQK